MRVRVIAIGTLLLFCAGILTLAQQNSPAGNALFEEGSRKEKGEADYEGAIQIYLRIVRDSQFDKDSQLIGKALIRLGRCYEELNQQAKAREYYQQVIDKYATKPDMAALVREAGDSLREQTSPPAGPRVTIQTPFTEDPFSFAISPDGRYLVYQAKVEGKSQLWLEDLNTKTRKPISGTENARAYAYPFWKPDSQAIGFFAEQKLKTIGIGGGVAQELAVADASARNGGAWSTAGVILFSANRSLYRIPERGGEPVAATAKGSDQAHSYPRFFPDGNHFLFYRVNGGFSELKLGSLDSPTVQTVSAGFAAAVVATDQLVYASGVALAEAGALNTQRFNPQTLQLTGSSIRIVDRVGMDRNYPGLAALSSSSERLVYRADGAVERQFVWRDRTGKVTGRLGPVDKASPSGFRISPDGQTVMYKREVRSGAGSLWKIDVAGGEPSMFRDAATRVAWSPGGDELVLAALPEQSFILGLFRQPLNALKGPGNWIALTAVAGALTSPEDLSENGFLLYSQYNRTSGFDLLAMSLPGGPPTVVAASPADETNGRFSPNGKWVAYQSDEVGGQNEIFVQPFPGLPSVRRKVSVDGGTSPHWGRGGRELYFLSADFHVMVAEVTFAANGEITDIKPPAPLFPSALPAGSEFVVTADGERFLINTPLEEAPPIYVLSNWPRAK